MKSLKSILTKIGTSIIKDVVPMGGTIIELVNGFLPDDKKLDDSATGQAAISAINQLPPDKQVEIYSKQLDVEITEIKEWSNIIGSLAQADATGSSTRPAIAHSMSHAVLFAIYMAISVWGIAMLIVVFKAKDPVDALKELVSSWPFIVSVLGVPTALLRAYFGMREREKTTRYHMAQSMQGAPPVTPEAGGVLSRIVKSIF